MPDDQAAVRTALTLRDYLGILLRRSWIVIVVAGIAFGVGLYRSEKQTKVYQAQGQLELASTGNANGTTSAADIDTQIGVVTSQTVHDAAAQKAPGIGEVSAQQAGLGNIMTVSATSTDPVQATRTVNATINAYVAYVQKQASDQALAAMAAIQGQVRALDPRIAAANTPPPPVGSVRASQRDALINEQSALQQRLDGLQVDLAGASAGVNVVGRPTLPTSPIRPNPRTDGLLALGAGLLLGLVLAFFVEYLVRSGETSGKQQAASQLPVAPPAALQPMAAAPQALAVAPPAVPQQLAVAPPAAPPPMAAAPQPLAVAPPAAPQPIAAAPPAPQPPVPPLLRSTPPLQPVPASQPSAAPRQPSAASQPWATAPVAPRADVRRTGDVSLLGVVPKSETSATEVVSLSAPESSAAQSYRSVRDAASFLGLERGGCFEVTSVPDRDGKTGTAANLAVQLARTGQRVVVVDCDLRKPRVHEFFGLGNEVGLTSVMKGAPLAEAVMCVPAFEHLYVLTSGPANIDAGEMVGSHRLGEIVASLLVGGTLVLIDAPPLLATTDALTLAKTVSVNGTILVATANTDARDMLRDALEALHGNGDQPIGVVLTSTTDRACAPQPVRAVRRSRGHRPAQDAIDAARPAEVTIGELRHDNAFAGSNGGAAAAEPRRP